MPSDITRPNVADTKPFWPANRAKLRVEISVVGDKHIATGVDPDTNALAFTAVLGADQDAAFLEAVRLGIPGKEIVASNDNTDPGVVTCTVIQRDPGPTGTGGSTKLYEVPLTLAMQALKRPTGT